MALKLLALLLVILSLSIKQTVSLRHLHSTKISRELKHRRIHAIGMATNNNAGNNNTSKKKGSRISPMVDNMATSKTIEIHSLTKDMESKGQQVFSLCVGEPDYQPPAEVIRATSAAADKGMTKYTAVTGDAKLRKAIAADLTSRKGTPYTPEQIVVANGAKQSVIQSLLSVVSPGDGVVIPSPYWPSYPDMVKMCGADPVVVETSASNGYILSGKDLRRALESNGRISCLIFCNPSNPTGGVANRQQLDEIAAVLRDFPDVIIIADEIYERLVYDIEHTSFASLEGMYDRTVVINGFSKSHSMTGYRIGYSASAMDIAKAVGKLQSQMTSCASSVGQEAARAALTEVGDEWIVDRVRELKVKRDLAYDLLLSIPHLTCPKPDGAFYLLPDVSHYYGKTTPAGAAVDGSHALCLELLRSRQVALVSGDAFGDDRCIRLSYAASEELITNSINRLKDFLLALK